jgi:hypothetical protein
MVNLRSTVPARGGSVHCDPFQAGGEEFLFGIERDDVGAQHADATVWTKGDLGHQAGVVFVESLE